MKWVKRIGLGILVVFVIGIFGWVPFWLGGLATRNRFHYDDRENAGLTPASFQLPFEEVAFQAKDGVTLKGWWVPVAQPKGTVVLVHGLNRSRIEMVKKTPFLNKLGWNALLFDLRHHGESGGDKSSFGYFEKNDVHAAVDFARQRSPGVVVLWGVSLGAASAALASSEDPGVAGLVCDSTYRSLRDTVGHHVRLFRSIGRKPTSPLFWLRLVPVWPVSDEVVYWIGRRGGFDPDAVDIHAAVARMAGRPILFVCNSGDRRMPAEIAYELRTAAGDHAQLLVVPGNSHGGAYRDGTAAYEKAVTDLLAAASAGATPRMASGRTP